MPKPPLVNRVQGSYADQGYTAMPSVMAQQRRPGMQNGQAEAEPLPGQQASLDYLLTNQEAAVSRGLSNDEREALLASGVAGPLSGVATMASSAPGRAQPVGPGSAGLATVGEETGPRQLTSEDMNKVVAGTALESSESKARDAQNLLAAGLDLSKARLQSLDEGVAAGVDGNGCFHVRHVEVAELLEDNTLGLLLHGTSVVGFCSSRAESAGWRVGDQIVEVNGQRVASFDEFLECFVQSQADHGLPIDFSVLRRELRPLAGEPDEAEDALEHFFSATNFVDLAGQLQSKFGSSADRGQSFGEGDDYGGLVRSESMSILENPYIQALRRRRDELVMNTEGWAGAAGGAPVDASIASRLATRKDAGIATLEDGEHVDLKPCGWPFCVSEGRSNNFRNAPIHEVHQTPRADAFDTIEGETYDASAPSTEKIAGGASAPAPRQWNEASHTWDVFDASDSAATGAETGLPSGPATREDSSDCRSAEKENAMAEREGSCVENTVDKGDPDDLKNSGAPDRPQPNSAGGGPSRNFATRLLPIGNSR